MVVGNAQGTRSGQVPITWNVAVLTRTDDTSQARHDFLQPRRYNLQDGQLFVEVINAILQPGNLAAQAKFKGDIFLFGT
jgi:hypothetical protein